MRCFCRVAVCQSTPGAVGEVFLVAPKWLRHHAARTEIQHLVKTLNGQKHARDARDEGAEEGLMKVRQRGVLCVREAKLYTAP